MIKKIVLLLLNILLLVNVSCSGGGAGGSSSLPPENLSDKYIELELPLTNITSNVDLMPSKDANLSENYNFTIADINDVTLKNIKVETAENNLLKFVINLKEHNGIIQLLAIDKNYNRIIYRNLLGALPECSSINTDKIKISKIKLDVDTTTKALYFLSDKTKIPYVTITRNDIDFEKEDTDFEKTAILFLSKEKEKITELKKIYNILLKFLTNKNLKINEQLSNNNLNNVIKSFVKVLKLYKDNEKDIISVLKEKPVIKLNKKIIDETLTDEDIAQISNYLKPGNNNKFIDKIILSQTKIETAETGLEIDLSNIKAFVVYSDNSSKEINLLWQSNDGDIIDNRYYYSEKPGENQLTAIYSENGIKKSTKLTINLIPTFNIVVLPDTQGYNSYFPKIFLSQTKWIESNSHKLNIKVILGLGDIVDNGSNQIYWKNASSAVEIINKINLPYLQCIGNHDYDSANPSLRSTLNFNKNFGKRHYSKLSWFNGNTYENDKYENCYFTYNILNQEYLFMTLEFFPRQEVIEWANKIASENYDKMVIITTHAYLFSNGEKYNDTFLWSPKSYGLNDYSDGEKIWNNFLKINKNITLILCGHVIDGYSYRSDLGDNGNIVNQILSDYQGEPLGGSGYLRLIKFYPSLKKIKVSSYSPYENKDKDDNKNKFELNY